jgi:hypothetical protein
MQHQYAEQSCRNELAPGIPTSKRRRHSSALAYWWRRRCQHRVDHAVRRIYKDDQRRQSEHHAERVTEPLLALSAQRRFCVGRRA